jgi:hypothetical protein
MLKWRLCGGRQVFNPEIMALFGCFVHKAEMQ